MMSSDSWVSTFTSFPLQANLGWGLNLMTGANFKVLDIPCLPNTFRMKILQLFNMKNRGPPPVLSGGTARGYSRYFRFLKTDFGYQHALHCMKEDMVHLFYRVSSFKCWHVPVNVTRIWVKNLHLHIFCMGGQTRFWRSLHVWVGRSSVDAWRLLVSMHETQKWGGKKGIKQLFSYIALSVLNVHFL